MKKRDCLYLCTVGILLFMNSVAVAQTVTTCVGLVLKTDSTDGVLMPQIVKILPVSAAGAETTIKEGMYVLKVEDAYCRNTPLDFVVHHIKGEEGTPVKLTISDSKDIFPKFAYVLRRGPEVTTEPASDAAKH